MKKKQRMTLGKRLVWFILLMSVTLCTTALLATYKTYGDRMDEHYIHTGKNLVGTLASQINADDLDRYFASLKTDDQYFKTQDFILSMIAENDVQYLYIVRPHGVGVTFLFDSDMSKTTGYDEGGYCSLGSYTDLAGDFVPNIPALLKGEVIAPIIQHDDSYGWLLTVSCPVLHADGTMAGYVMADINMSGVVRDRQTFLISMATLLAVLTGIFSLGYLYYIRKTVVDPVRQLTQAVQEYEGGGDKRAFANVEIKTRDEFRTLADAFQNMLVKVEDYNKEQAALAAREEHLAGDLKLTAEVNASILPRELPDLPSKSAFEVRGLAERSQALSCNFYDYFFIDPGLLCVMIGETPALGISSALFMVVAQTTVRSQLRQGLSLVEAMTAANRQIYEIGGGLVLPVLVGTLSVGDGHFSYINAGEQPPLLMVNQEQYEWLKSQHCAPLGMNENVSYRVESVQLKQSDRLFLATGGLGAVTDREGRRFAENRLRMALNISRGKELDLDQLLEEIGDEAEAFSGAVALREGYSMLALEYKKVDRNVIRWAGPGAQERAGEIIGFLKRQFEENGISRREYARVAVMVEELFALCCRRQVSQEQITVECNVAPDAQLVTIRIMANLGGRNPFEAPEGETEKNVVAFLQENAVYIKLKSAEGRDKITLVSGIEATNTIQ